MNSYGYGLCTKISTEGIINTSTIKSKMSNLIIEGFTDDIGNEQKSLDNPHQLISLDNTLNNLYSEDNVTTHNIYITDNNNSTSTNPFGTINKHTYSITISISCKPNTTYTIDRFNTTGYGSSNLIIGCVNSIDDIIIGNKCNSVKSCDLDVGSTTFTTDNNANILLVQVWDYDTYDNTHSGLMIFEGVVENTEYYMPGTSSGIVIKHNNKYIYVPTIYTLMSVNNVVDYIELQSDGWHLIKNIDELVLTKDTTLTLQSTNSNNIDNFQTSYSENAYYYGKAISTHFTNQLSVIANTSTEGMLMNSSRFYFRINHDRFNGNVDNFKSWINSQYIQGTPIKIQYQLAESKDVILPDTTQNILNNIILCNGNNNISISGGPTIKLTAYQSIF